MSCYIKKVSTVSPIGDLGENISHIKYKDVKPYTYTEDGLTLEKRVLKYIKYFLIFLNFYRN